MNRITKASHQHEDRELSPDDTGVTRASFDIYECLCSAYSLAALATTQSGLAWRSLGNFMESACIATNAPVASITIHVPARSLHEATVDAAAAFVAAHEKKDRS